MTWVEDKRSPPGTVERVDKHCRIPRRPTKAGHFLEMKNRAGNPSRSDRLPARCISPLLKGVYVFTETGERGAKIPHMPRIGGVQWWCTGFLQVLFTLLRLLPTGRNHGTTWVQIPALPLE